MKPTVGALKQFQVGSLKVQIHSSRELAGEAAAQAAVRSLRDLATRKSTVGVVFATGASQIATLGAMTSIPGAPWDQVVGFHMDEYVGISPENPASFRHYLRERLTRRVRLHEFHEIDATSPDSARTCAEYASLLRGHDPQLCLLASARTAT
ncbi:MAG: hypothetical protein ACRD11_13970 [Terriglobia bacterium]